MLDPATMALDQLERKLRGRPRSLYDYEIGNKRTTHELYLKKAVLQGDLPRVEVYLRCGASPDPIVIMKPNGKKKKNADWHPLLWAVMSGKLEMVDLLLQFGANVDAVGLSAQRQTALRVAVQNENVAIVHKLLSVGASPESYRYQDHTITIKDQETGDKHICCDIPVLYDAVKRKNVEIAELLLRKGAKANLPKSYERSYSYLTEAIRAKSPEVVALLLQFGADANFEVPNLGTTPLMMAANAKTHAVSMTRKLTEHGANVNARECVHPQQDALTIAVLNKNPGVVQVLLATGARVNAVESAPLSAAATVTAPTKTSVEIINLLVDYGADVNACGPSGVEPLFAAVEKQNTVIVEALLKRGARADVVHGDMTPLKLAVLKQDVKLARVLVQHGASPTARVFAPSMISEEREICSSAFQLAMQGQSSATLLAIFNDPHFREHEPWSVVDEEEKMPAATPFSSLSPRAFSHESAVGRLQPIGLSNQSAMVAAVDGSYVDVKRRTLTQAVLSVTWALCYHAGRSLNCEWELVAPKQNPPMTSVATSTCHREPMDGGVVLAHGKTATASPPELTASWASSSGGSALAEWPNDTFTLNVGGESDTSGKAKTQTNQRTLQSCVLRFRVKIKSSFLSKTVGEAWFQLSQLDSSVPSGTTTKFLVELSHKKKRTGTMAFQLTF